MNAFLLAFINLFRVFDGGHIADYPDPADPSDLGDPLTQDEIDFVKKLKKEMEERFPDLRCLAEKTGVSITDAAANNFTIVWTNPAGYLATTISYRVMGDSVWKAPNLTGTATGAFSGTTSFIFDSGFSGTIIYEIRVQNTCANSVISNGVIVSAEATAP